MAGGVLHVPMERVTWRFLMINRRRFVSSVGATALLPVLPASINAHQAPPEPHGNTRARVDLNGIWERHVNGTLLDSIQVPSSQRPSGFYRLKRTFILPKPAPGVRTFIRFDAITYHGRVFVNGHDLGVMGPYVPHEFEITSQAREGSNSADVAIADLSPDPTGAGKDEISLGINPGWEAYGGIIRDAYVELRPAAFIDNVQLSYNLEGDYARVRCRAKLFLSSSVMTSGQVELTLRQGQAEVARSQTKIEISKGNSEGELSFELTTPALWSPEEPNLYR